MWGKVLVGEMSACGISVVGRNEAGAPWDPSWGAAQAQQLAEQHLCERRASAGGRGAEGGVPASPGTAALTQSPLCQQQFH